MICTRHAYLNVMGVGCLDWLAESLHPTQGHVLFQFEYACTPEAAVTVDC